MMQPRQPTSADTRSVLFFSLPRPLKRALSSSWLCAAAAALLAGCCYWNSLQGDLVHDDIFAIKDNADVTSSTPISELFRNDFWGKPMSSVVSHKSYRPLTVLTFRFNYALHGLDPWGYHVVNVALHMLVTVLFGWFCREIVFSYNDLSLLAMLLFAAHPVHTEAVSWEGGVAGRGCGFPCWRVWNWFNCFLLTQCMLKQSSEFGGGVAWKGRGYSVNFVSVLLMGL